MRASQAPRHQWEQRWGVTRRNREQELGPAPFDEGGLKGHTPFVLTTALLAAAWPEEFPDGWVGMEDVLHYSKHGADKEDDATRQAFYRSRHRIEEHFPWLRFEDRVVGIRAKARIHGSLPPALLEWLWDHGDEFIKQSEWDRFVAARVRPPETPEETDTRLQAATARVLVMQGRTDEALRMLQKSLAQPTSLRHEMALRLAWTFAVIRAGRIREFKGALRALSDLVKRDLPTGDLTDRLLKARLRVELAYGRYLAEVMGRKDSDRIRETITQCSELLAGARRFQGGLSQGDQARLENVSALFTKARARIAEGVERERLFEDAKHGFLKSFSLAESVDDAYGMAATLYNVGELCYARDRLDLMTASVDQATEALSWFRRSVAVAEQLGITRDLYLDYARIADVLGVLILARLRAGLTADLDRLMSEADWHLAQVKSHGNPLEQKLARWTNGRLGEVARTAGVERRRAESAA